MHALSSILVGVDFSPCSEAALRQAARLGTFSNAAVHAVNVTEPMVYDITQPVVMLPIPTAADLASDARERWPRFASDIPGRAAVTFEALIGSPVAELASFAKDVSADLLVLGAHSTLDRSRAIGSIAASTARHAPCDTLVVREDQTGPFRRVLVAVDFSPSSLSAVDAAVRIASSDGAGVVILHSYTDPLRGRAVASQIHAHMPDFKAKFEESIRAQLAKFTEPLQHELAAVRPQFVAVDAVSYGQGIVTAAHDFNADLVVLGARGHSRLHGLVFGSTAERVVRDARCSVLVVRS